MSRLTPSEPIAVRVGDCLCQGTPHADGDVVFLDPNLSLDGGLWANSAIATFGDDPQRLERELGLAYLLGGISGWNFLDDAGASIPVNPDTIRRALPWGAGGRLVAERANELYYEAVVRPLVDRLQTRSAPGATGSSTSPVRPPKAGTRKPRGSSSPVTSQLVSMP